MGARVLASVAQDGARAGAGVRSHGRTDANHQDFGTGMRNAGWLMADTSSVGNGFPDWVGGAPDGTLFAFELKDPDKPPSARALTPKQQAFHQFWRRCATLMVVLSVEQALEEYAQPTRRRK